ncbi:MAG TPA: hypothetical protein VGD75_01050, partial [Bradyrhizobium sp.]
TAPFLLNNSLGPFDPDPSVDARVRVFDASIEQLLWPEKRARDPLLGDKIPGVIDRTTERSFITIPEGYVPDALRPAQGVLHRWLPQYFGGTGDITIGPIPKGVPVNLLADIQPLAESSDPLVIAAHTEKLLALLNALRHDLAAAPADATDAQLREKFANLAKPMLELSKCPDFVVNRGHYFGTNLFAEEQPLSDEDKHALIAFLKTF